MRKMQGSVGAASLSAGNARLRATTTMRRFAGAGAPRFGGTGVALLLSILLWLMFYANLPLNFGLNGTPVEASDGPGHTLTRFVKMCLLAMSLYVIATRFQLVRSYVRYLNPGMAALFALVPLSAVWSIDKDATISASVSLASIILICFAICLAGWHPRRFQELVTPPLILILLVSLVVGMMFPDRIVELGDDISQKNAWHGITLSKNQFAMTASLAVILCVHRWLAREGRIYWSIAGAAVGVLCLVLSRGNTSQLATLVSVAFIVLALRIRVVKGRLTALVAAGLTATMILYELVIQNMLPGAYTLLSPVRALTGKDSTFSARTMIWDIVKDHIQAAPYLGTGYGAYWVGPVAGSPSNIFMYLMWFYPTEAHNGYLDIVNDLGYLGLVLLLLFIFSYLRQALQLIRFDRNQAVLYLALLFQTMVINMSESDWFARDSTFTVLALAVFCMGRQLLSANARRRAG